MQSVIEASIRGVSFELKTHPDLFSPRRVDQGTLAMLEAVELSADDRLLDLGCGYGVVGIYAATILGAENVCLTDSCPTAVATARANAEANGLADLSVTLSDGFRDFHESGFTRILSNPPYHADFSVPKHFIMKGFNRLAIGGEMWFVTKRDKWYRNKLRTIFGNAVVQERGGYFLLHATKKHANYARRR